MAERSVHEAAVAAGAAGLCVRDGEGCPAHHLCEAEARRVIAALVASAEVQEGLANAKCLVHPDLDKCGGAVYGINVRFHLPCIRAALGGGES